VSNNPVNLAVRFLLELAALAALGFWAWTTQDGILRPALTLGLPVAAAFLWGTFRVPNDPGPAPVAVPGIVRLLLELALFVSAAGLLVAADQPTAAAVLAAVTTVHYLVSYDRVRWLIAQRGR
jgi:hypothetical protein